MKLIKCIKCGRPFYNSEEKCPYCGLAASESANNFITKPITTPESHKTMERMLSGNHDNETVNEQPAVVENIPTSVPAGRSIAEPETEVVVEQVAEAAVNAAAAGCEAVNERAEAIAAVADAQPVVENNCPVETPTDQVETEYAPKKKRGWIWIIVILILLAIAAAVYLKWDYVYSKVTSLLK